MEHTTEALSLSLRSQQDQNISSHYNHSVTNVASGTHFDYLNLSPTTSQQFQMLIQENRF
jgi:hypothetical protein